MTSVERSTVVAALYDIGLDEDSLRADYSGRGMYGSTCVGIVCDTGEAMRFIAEVAVREAEAENSYEWVGNARADNMGLSTIWYWPGTTLEDDDREEKPLCPTCGSADVRRATTAWQCNTCPAEWGDD